MFLPWGPCKGPRRRQTSVGPKTPCWAPACITPDLPCALKKQKSHLAKQTGWRGRVGNSSMLIPNRIPGPRRSVLWRRLYFSSNGIWFGRERRKAARVNEKLYVISVTQGLFLLQVCGLRYLATKLCSWTEEKEDALLSPLYHIRPPQSSWNMHPSPSS